VRLGEDGRHSRKRLGRRPATRLPLNDCEALSGVLIARPGHSDSLKQGARRERARSQREIGARGCAQNNSRVTDCGINTKPSSAFIASTSGGTGEAHGNAGSLLRPACRHAAGNHECGQS
jgi:hypothetical protein